MEGRTINDFIVTPLLQVGRENARLQADLCSATGLKPGVFKKQVKKERLAKSLICSCEHGYFLGETAEELAAFVRAEESQAKSRLAITAPFRARLKEIAAADQMSLDQLLEALNVNGEPDGTEG